MATVVLRPAAETFIDTKLSTATEIPPRVEHVSKQPFFLHYEDISGDDLIFERDDDGNKVKLGVGGFGVVYRGEYRKLPGVKVAIKKLTKCEYGIKKRDIKLLKRDSFLQYRLRHPDVVTVYGMCIDDTIVEHQLYCIVSEYMEMGSLDELLEKVLIPWEVKVKMFEGMSRGLNYVYNLNDDYGDRLIHGDIKARNVLVDEHFRAKVGDFNIGTLQMTTSQTTHHYFKGTMTHVAPELLDIPEDDDGDYDPGVTELSDVYAFGVTMFEAAAENKPPKDSPEYGHPRYRRPFPVTMTDMQITKKLTREMNSVLTPKQKEKIPEDCPQFYIKLMERCCSIDKELRPTFKEVTEEIHKGFQTMNRTYYAAMAELYRRMDKDVPSEEDMRQSQEEDEEYNRTFDGTEFLQQNNTYRSLNFDRKVGPVTRDDWNSLRIEVMKLRELAEKRAMNDKFLSREHDDIKKQLRNFHGKHSPICFNDLEEVQEDLRQVTKHAWHMREEDLIRIETDQSRSHIKQSPIRLNYVYLMKNMIALEITDYLFQDQILEQKDLDKIMAQKIKRDKNAIILRKADSHGAKGLKSLVNALDMTEQRFVADAIRNDYKLHNLQTNTELLMYYMKIEPVLIKLFSCGILDEDDKDMIRAEPRQSHKVLFILDAIDRGGPAAVQTLIDVLEETDQTLLAKKLKQVEN